VLVEVKALELSKLMRFGSPQEKDSAYVLACPRKDGNIAILARTVGAQPGPALCQSKKEAVALKTKLANDPRGMGNHRALEIIKSLLIYKISLQTEPVWEPGQLWAYLPASCAECVESQSSFFL